MCGVFFFLVAVYGCVCACVMWFGGGVGEGRGEIAAHLQAAPQCSTTSSVGINHKNHNTQKKDDHAKRYWFYISVKSTLMLT